MVPKQPFQSFFRNPQLGAEVSSQRNLHKLNIDCPDFAPDQFTGKWKRNY